jgi:hypothetical protein
MKMMIAEAREGQDQVELALAAIRCWKHYLEETYNRLDSKLVYQKRSTMMMRQEEKGTANP